MGNNTNIVHFENVSMRYGLGADIFHNVTFKLQQGSFHFLTGPSGAGKSSLIRMMYLGHQNYRGSVKLFDRDASTIGASDLPGLRQNIGIVFQDFHLLDHISAIDNVALPLRVRGMDLKQSRAHAREILNWVGLEDCLDARPDALSGGQKQRVAIARAVIGKPKLLLADEPTGNVDDKIAVKLIYLFEELNRMGTTIVLATHNHDLSGEFPHPRLHLENQTLAVYDHNPEQERISVNA
jgi:cell division transport system ATP-binding protein